MPLIELPHKVCGLTCMINGLEDMYEHQTGVRLPDWLLLFVSGLLGVVYLKNKNAPTPRMVFWGAQIARYQYEALADVVGFQWQMVAGRGFAHTLQRVRDSIDRGVPALLGAMDMYHLPYYDKFYHTYHVPIHHVLMVGYDEPRQAALVLDCDRPAVQEIPYADLEAAWDVHVPGMGTRNTFYTFAWDEHPAGVETIARRGLHKQAAAMLQSPVSIQGLKGMYKLAHDLPRWPAELDAGQLDVSLRHLAEFTGFPPIPPNRLTGYEAPDDHGAGRDAFAALLRRLSVEYDEPAWAAAAPWFERSAQVLKELTDRVVDFLLGQVRSLDPAAASVATIADLEEQGFRALRDR